MPILRILTAYLHTHSSSDSKYQTALSQTVEKYQNHTTRVWNHVDLNLHYNQTLRPLVLPLFMNQYPTANSTHQRHSTWCRWSIINVVEVILWLSFKSLEHSEHVHCQLTELNLCYNGGSTISNMNILGVETCKKAMAKPMLSWKCKPQLRCTCQNYRKDTWQNYKFNQQQILYNSKGKTGMH